MVMRRFILITALMMGDFNVVCAEKVNFNDIIIDNVWIKDTPPNHKITAGYLTIENLSDTDATLLSVSSSFAKKGEIHQLRMDGKVMKMRPITSWSMVFWLGELRASNGNGDTLWTRVICHLRNGMQRRQTSWE